MVCESAPSWSNHYDSCRSSGYYSDCVSPFVYQNSTCYSFTNASDCGGSYHVDSSGCYQDVAHVNVSNNKNWSNGTPPCDSTQGSCSFGNTCSWGGDHHDCSWGNSCRWGGNYTDSYWYYTCEGPPMAYCDATQGYTWPDGSCMSFCNHGAGLSGGSEWPDHVNNGWGDSCYTGYPNSCYYYVDGPGDSCYVGYPNSCYYYANHTNTPPFNNFCNHSNAYS